MADIVVDVGNSRLKWGRCHRTGIAEIARLAADPQSWEDQRRAWNLPIGTIWRLASVQPTRATQFADWVQSHGDSVEWIRDYRQLPLTVDVDEPARVGIDRLMNAIAIIDEIPRDQAAVIVDAGTAITVDWLTGDRTFHGGAILPGVRLMARSLAEYTAALPEIELVSHIPALPGRNTVAALQVGITWAARGGIDALIRGYSRNHPTPRVIWTGGDAPLLAGDAEIRPDLTLEGIRRSPRPST